MEFDGIKTFWAKKQRDAENASALVQLAVAIPTQGIAVLEIMRILDGYDLDALGPADEPT